MTEHHHDHAAGAHGHHEHAAHGHSHQGHHGHGPVAHGAPADWRVAYTRAYEAAEPEPGREVVSIPSAAVPSWSLAPTGA